MRQSWHQGKKDIYAHVRNTGSTTTQALLVNGAPTANPEQMHQAVVDAWMKSFRRYANGDKPPDVHSFRQKYSKYIKTQACDLPRLTSEHPARTINRWKNAALAGP